MRRVMQQAGGFAAAAAARRPGGARPAAGGDFGGGRPAAVPPRRFSPAARSRLRRWHVRQPRAHENDYQFGGDYRVGRAARRTARACARARGSHGPRVQRDRVRASTRRSRVVPAEHEPIRVQERLQQFISSASGRDAVPAEQPPNSRSASFADRAPPPRAVRGRPQFDHSGFTLAAAHLGKPGRPARARDLTAGSIMRAVDLLCAATRRPATWSRSISPVRGFGSRSTDALSFGKTSALVEVATSSPGPAAPCSATLAARRSRCCSRATFPERVDKLVMLEGGVPVVGRLRRGARRRRAALLEPRALLAKSGRVFTDRDTAIEERAPGFTKLNRAAADSRAGSLRAPGGFQWHADQRSEGSAGDAAHARARPRVRRRVRAPALRLSPSRARSPTEALRGDDRPFAAIEVVRVPGGHHLHLEGAEAEIAERILRFFGPPA